MLPLPQVARGVHEPTARGYAEALKHRSEEDVVSQALNPQVVRRLAFIRFMYTEGLENARRAQPLGSTGLSLFHDAVEMFLLLAAEHLGVSLPKHVDFDGYFTEIAKATNMQLPARNAMRRLNNSRVNFKHHGSIPSATDLEQFRADVTTFLTDATQMVFAADFARLDMTDLVTQQGALEKLRDAEAHAGRGDHIEALALLSEAFDGLLDDYADRKRGADGSSPYMWLPRWGFSRMPLNRRDHDPKLVERTDHAFTALESLQRAMRVLAMGLDYRRYARFDLLVPHIAWFADGHRDVRPVPGLQVGDDEYEFCRQFVIETALHLAEMDFDLDVFSLWREHREHDRAAPPDGSHAGT